MVGQLFHGTCKLRQVVNPKPGLCRPPAATSPTDRDQHLVDDAEEDVGDVGHADVGGERHGEQESAGDTREERQHRLPEELPVEAQVSHQRHDDGACSGGRWSGH